MEGELIAMDTTGHEIEWLKNSLLEILLVKNPMLSIFVICDNQFVISVCKNKYFNNKMKHLSIRHSTVRNLIKNEHLVLEYVKSEDNRTNPLTKDWQSRKLYIRQGNEIGAH